MVNRNDAHSLTHSGSVMGTTHYLSPEQVQGAPLDGRSDEYALGVILYECLTGRRPHEGDTLYAIMRSISEGRFAPPRVLRPDLSTDLEAVVLRAMGTRADDRFPSVHALGCALLGLASPRGRVLWSDYFARPLDSLCLRHRNTAHGLATLVATDASRTGHRVLGPRDSQRRPAGVGHSHQRGHATPGFTLATNDDRPRRAGSGRGRLHDLRPGPIVDRFRQADLRCSPPRCPESHRARRRGGDRSGPGQRARSRRSTGPSAPHRPARKHPDRCALVRLQA